MFADAVLTEFLAPLMTMVKDICRNTKGAQEEVRSLGIKKNEMPNLVWQIAEIEEILTSTESANRKNAENVLQAIDDNIDNEFTLDDAIAVKRIVKDRMVKLRNEFFDQIFRV